jgi:site-specific recombinase XerD
MAIFKRGKVYWFHFYFSGQHIQKSTKQGNPRVARQMEAAYRTAMAKGEVGITERKPAPTLADFAQRFIDFVQVRNAAKPQTVLFYVRKLANLQKWEQLACAPLDRIDESLIESYVQQRSKKVSPASVNRELATLRRLLRLAYEWHVIERVPRIRLLPGEKSREFVLAHDKEQTYLDAAPQPLGEVAVFILDTGMRVGEVLALEWRDVRLEPAQGASLGYLHVRSGKSRNAKRNLCITERVRRILERRIDGNETPWVFTSQNGKDPLSIYTLDDQHWRLRAELKLSKEFVIHSLRHTMLTRMGEAGADAFTIMRIAGHSSVTVSQRYVHPSPESVERAFQRMEALNETAKRKALQGQKRQLPATISATVGELAEVAAD